MTSSTRQRTAFEAFLQGMHAGDADAIARHLTETVVLNSPFLAEPVTGKDAVAGVLGAVANLADDLTVREVLSGENHHAAFFTLKIKDTVVDGMDYALLDADDKIVELTVLWRPLPLIVEMQATSRLSSAYLRWSCAPRGETMKAVTYTRTRDASVLTLLVTGAQR